MPASHTSEPALLEPKGPVITAIACIVGGVMMVGGGAAAVLCTVLAATGLGGTRGGWVWIAAGLALVAALVAYGGFCTILNAREERRATIQLATLGVDATAFVLKVSSAPPTHDDYSQVRLLMRISGPGFATFESSHEVPTYRFGSATRGTVLRAWVDPTSLMFTLERPSAPGAPSSDG